MAENKKDNDIEHLEKIEHKLLKETEKIEEAEEKIEKEEHKISRIEHKILKDIEEKPVQTLMYNGLTKTELGYLRKVFVHKIARHKYIFTLLITLGVVLVWRGFWETTANMPILSYPVVALVSGVMILWLLERITRIN